MNIFKEIVQAIAIKLGFIASPAMDPFFRAKHRKNNLKITVALILYLFLSQHFLGTSCVMQSTLGVPCPTCGSTRATYALLRGNFGEAFYWHPLIILSLLILGVAVFLVIKDEIKKQRAFRKGGEYVMRSLPRKFWHVFVFILLLYLTVFIIRLIYVAPQAPLNFNQNSILGRLLRLWKSLFSH